ncbi:unannotated protein [freshwater metagenome]|uniref:Unannotated protein n=1 Tax=freshwater metagenome TaxID=449393 RepID=A0A6J7SL34_9ZZZZ
MQEGPPVGDRNSTSARGEGRYRDQDLTPTHREDPRARHRRVDRRRMTAEVIERGSHARGQRTDGRPTLDGHRAQGLAHSLLRRGVRQGHLGERGCQRRIWRGSSHASWQQGNTGENEREHGEPRDRDGGRSHEHPRSRRDTTSGREFRPRLRRRAWQRSAAMAPHRRHPLLTQNLAERPILEPSRREGARPRTPTMVTDTPPEVSRAP